MISQTVEYALRAVVFLADRSPQPGTTLAMAKATRVPAAYLRKVLKCLSDAGIVKLTRGASGGVTLAKSPAECTILDVVNAVDPIPRIRVCPLGLASHGIRLCPLHRRLDQALATVEQAFRQSTLAEVLTDPSKSRPLCDLPRAPHVKKPGFP